MNNALNIPGSHPLTPEEKSGLQEFKTQMETVVIPQLVERDFENRKRVVESRNWFVD
ncbi:MAG: hypothetical protein Q8P17_05010 [bacterium]|nr:hypothetical protein [bacterium]